MEHIDTIGQLPTDDRDRPLSPVVITHCGELELRRPPQKPRARSASISSSFSDRSRSRSRSRSPSRNRSRDASSPDRSASTKRRSRSRKYSDSGTESEYDSDDSRERRRRRKDRKRSKRSKSKSKSKSRRHSRGRDSESEREETLSELDARLEREEKEKLEKERLEKLAEMKRKIEEEKQRVKDAGGVIYKGERPFSFFPPHPFSLSLLLSSCLSSPFVKKSKNQINRKLTCCIRGINRTRGDEVPRPGNYQPSAVAPEFQCSRWTR